MKLIKFICAGLLVSCISYADQVTVPNTFSPGTKALSSQVNENFAVLAVESNAQDRRLGALEAMSAPQVTDQLICFPYDFEWVVKNLAYKCVQRSDPTNIRSLTYAQVAEEGWVAVSVGPGYTYIFSK